MDPALCEKHHPTIAKFYHSNMISCVCVSRYTMEDAYRKIDEMIDHVKEGRAFVFGCLTEDLLAGYLWSYPYCFRSEHRLYVSELHVSEAYRGRGIGTGLLRMAEQEAVRQGLHALYLHAEAVNEKAIRFYEKMGYEMERVQLSKRS